jgi:TonB family protein
MGTHYDRAVILYRSKQYELAEKEFRLELAEKPDNANAHSMLAFTLFKRRSKALELAPDQRTRDFLTRKSFMRLFTKQSQTAELLEQTQAEAKEAVRLAPDSAFSHYCLAYVFYYGGKTKEGKRALEQAMSLNPTDSYQFGLASAIAVDQKRWLDALTLAEQGLKFDPEHVDCINSRALALARLGRKQEAEQSLNKALAADPEDYRTHAHKAGVALEQRDSMQALEHYREALRLNPNSQWAREGVVKALKAKNPIYCWLLSSSLWLSSINWRIRIILILVLFVPLYFVSVNNLSVFRYLITFGYLMLAIAGHCFNIALSFDPLGRTVLSKNELDESRRFVVGFLLIGLIAVGIIFGGYLSEAPSIDAVIATAQNCIHQGQIGKAHSYYNELLGRASSQVREGRLQDASEIYHKVIDNYQKDFGQTDTGLPGLLLSSAKCDESLGNHRQSEHLAGEAIAILKETKGTPSSTLGLAYSTLARAQQNSGQGKEAEDSLKQYINIFESDSLHSHDLIKAYNQYAEVLKANGKDAKAKEISAKSDKVVDYQPYMAAIALKIKQTWRPAERNSSKKAILTFQILSDGKVEKAEIKSSSQDADMDKAALLALKQASPFPPIPKGATAPLSIEFSFDYNVFKSNPNN